MTAPKVFLSADLKLSMKKNLTMGITVYGDTIHQIEPDDVVRMKSQFDRWIEGLAEAFDDARADTTPAPANAQPTGRMESVGVEGGV